MLNMKYGSVIFIAIVIVTVLSVFNKLDIKSICENLLKPSEDTAKDMMKLFRKNGNCRKKS